MVNVGTADGAAAGGVLCWDLCSLHERSAVMLPDSAGNSCV